MTREEAADVLRYICDSFSCEDCKYKDTDKCTGFDYCISAMYKAIKTLEQPEIIRCKNCKYSSNESFCSLYYRDKPYEEDFYCSYAERRE